MGTQVTKTAEYAVKIDLVAERLKEVDQVKQELGNFRTNAVQQDAGLRRYGKQLEGLADRTQVLEKDTRRIEAHDEKFNTILEEFTGMQSNMANGRGLVTDVQTQQETQKA